MHEDTRVPRPLPPSLSRRSALGRVLLLITGTLTVAGAQAGRLEKRTFNISSGTAPEALAEFIHQSGLQVLFDFDAICTITTQQVSGQYDPAEALARMFEGSGLTFEFINERTISVRPRSAEKFLRYKVR